MKATIAKMVKLARLKLPEQEWDRFAGKAEHIVEYIEKLKTIDTAKIEPTSHATPPPVSPAERAFSPATGGGAIEIVNAFREDAIQPFADAKKILAAAPATHENFFEVPKVIDEA